MCKYIKKFHNNKKPILYFSVEMSAKELTDRLISILTGFNSDYLTHPRLYFIDNEIEINDKNIREFKFKIKEAIDEINSWNLLIDYNEDMSIKDVSAKSNKIKLQQGDLGAIFIDHSGIINNGIQNDPNGTQNIMETYKEARRFAKRLKVPTIILNQFLKSGIDERDNYIPDLQSLPGGQVIKADSHVVMMIYRPEMYAKLIAKRQDLKNLMMLLFPKVRGRKNPEQIDFWWNEGRGLRETKNKIDFKDLMSDSKDKK